MKTPHELIAYARTTESDGLTHEWDGTESKTRHLPATKARVEQVLVEHNGNLYRSRRLGSKWLPTEQVSGRMDDASPDEESGQKYARELNQGQDEHRQF